MARFGTIASPSMPVGGSSAPNQVSFSNAARTILAGECTGNILIVRQTGTLTTTRTLTLPAANSVPAGYRINVVDESGSPSWWYKILIAPAGSDVISGTNTAFELDKPWQSVQLIGNGSNGWNVSRSEVNRRDLWYVEDDLLHSGTITRGGFTSSGAGTGAGGQSAAFDADLGAIGVVRLLTGSTATGRFGLSTNNTGIVLGTATWRFYARVRLEFLPDATEDFTLEIGFSDGTGTEGSDGAYFLVDRSVNATNILACSSASGLGRTRVDTGVAFSGLTSGWFELGIECGATAAKYFINGVEVPGSTAALPNTSSRATGLLVQIRKTLGTTLRALVVDKAYYLYYTTTPR